jgi:hypothetical protein
MRATLCAEKKGKAKAAGIGREFQDKSRSLLED